MTGNRGRERGSDTQQRACLGTWDARSTNWAKRRPVVLSSFKAMQVVQRCFACGNLQNIKQVVSIFWLTGVHAYLHRDDFFAICSVLVSQWIESHYYKSSYAHLILLFKSQLIHKTQKHHCFIKVYLLTFPTQYLLTIVSSIKGLYQCRCCNINSVLQPNA